jgi:hypothetical protein
MAEIREINVDRGVIRKRWASSSDSAPPGFRV